MTNYSEHFTRVMSAHGLIYALQKDAPVKLLEMIKDCHLQHFYGALPNDWIFEHIYKAICWLELTADVTEDSASEFVEEECVCAYTAMKWISENYGAFANELADETLQNWIDNGLSFEQLLILTYESGLERIFNHCREWLEEQKVNEEEEEEMEE